MIGAQSWIWAISHAITVHEAALMGGKCFKCQGEYRELSQHIPR